MTFLKKIYKNLLSLIGLFILILYIWLRFIRERLPRDIPFDLSFYGMLFLIFLCYIYIYIIIITLFKKQETKNTIKSIIIEWILIPFKELDILLKNQKEIKIFFHKLINYTTTKYLSKEYKFLLYYSIIPSFILNCFFIIDVFYLKEIFLFYKFILLGLIVLIIKYILYTGQTLKDDLIEENKDLININMKYEYAIQIIEDTPLEDEEEDDFIPDTMNIPLSKCVQFQTQYFHEHKNYLPYKILSTSKGIELYEKSIHFEITSRERKFLHDKNANLVINLLQISLFLYEIQYTEKFLKNIKLYLITTFLISWLYILIVSLPNLYLDTFFYSLLETSFKQNDFDFQKDKNNYYEDDDI